MPTAWTSSTRTGAYAGGTLGGLDNVDLWIGGLAEKNMPFGGMLGSTFNFVFEMQLEKLQDGDRFYYLQRLDGLHLFSEMENNSFAKVICINADAGASASDVFSTPGLILEVDQTRQSELRGSTVGPIRPADTIVNAAGPARQPGDRRSRSELPALHRRRPRPAWRHRTGTTSLIASEGDDTL